MIADLGPRPSIPVAPGKAIRGDNRHPTRTCRPPFIRIWIDLDRLSQSSTERLGGILMLVSVALALVAANSALGPLYQALHHAPIHLRFGPQIVEGPLIEWINRGLITVFFFLVGLEMKREVLEGCLSSIDRCLLPAMAALGGIVAPALIYMWVTAEEPSALRGWAIPTATDIVLAVGILSLLGNRVPLGLRVFLTAVAIFDDIGAAIIIGVFYGSGFDAVPLAGAGVVLVVLTLWNRRGGRSVSVNALGALLVWLGFDNAGIEPALAGLPLAATIPLGRRPGSSMLIKAEEWLRPRVLLLIVPIFAFLNAGVRIDGAAVDNLLQPVSVGVIAGLVIGKPVGIFSAVQLARFAGIGALPPGLSPRLIFGIAQIAGAGFTMSFFLATLSFETAALAAPARLAILLGSTLSGMAGLSFLWVSSRPGGHRADSAIGG